MASDNKMFFLTKDNKNYLINGTYFDCTNKVFIEVDYATIISELVFNNGNTIDSIATTFIGNDGVTYNPLGLVNFNEYKLGVITSQEANLLIINYTLNNNSLIKTNIKIKEEYNKANYGMFFDIASNSKSKIDYYYDKNAEDISYDSCSNITKDIISKNFYANFKFNSSDGLITSATSYSKYKYRLMNKNDINVYNDFNGRHLVTFRYDNERVIVNRIIKNSVINTIDTLGKF